MRERAWHKNKNSILKLVTAILVASYAGTCDAQNVSAINKPSRDSLSFGNDVRYYQIINYQNNKDYLSYSRAVRERIKQMLKKNYRDYYREGDVSLLFIVTSDGRLNKFDIDNKNSTKDKKLIDIAVLSLKDASPFTPFPKNLPADELPFSLTVSFKEK